MCTVRQDIRQGNAEHEFDSTGPCTRPKVSFACAFGPPGHRCGFFTSLAEHAGTERHLYTKHSSEDHGSAHLDRRTLSTIRATPGFASVDADITSLRGFWYLSPTAAGVFRDACAGRLLAPCPASVDTSQEVMERTKQSKKAAFKACLGSASEPVSYAYSQVWSIQKG